MKNKILTILCLICGLLFVNAGLNKFFNYMPAPDDLPEKVVKMNTAMMEIGWLLPLVGAVELTGGLLFSIPRFSCAGGHCAFAGNDRHFINAHHCGSRRAAHGAGLICYHTVGHTVQP